jgi:prevent-host-death family protein
MERVGIYEAKAKLSDLVERVQKGEEVTITKHGKAVAKLVPAVRTGKSSRAEAYAAIDRLRRELKVTKRFNLREIMEEGGSSGLRGR